MDAVHQRLQLALESGTLSQIHLHTLHHNYTLRDAEELIYRCAVADPSVKILKVVVSLGGIWDLQKYGLWTRICLPEPARTSMQLHFNMLLHDTVIASTQLPDALPVIEFLLQEDIKLLGLRNGQGELPWQVGMKYAAPIKAVMMLVPANEHPLWANSDEELSPDALAEIMCCSLSDRGLNSMLPDYRKLHRQLCTRRDEIKGPMTKLDERQGQEGQVEEMIRLLQQLVDLSAAADTGSNKKLKKHVAALLQPPKLQFIKGNVRLLKLCSQSLCDALRQAATNHRLDFTGPVANMYRAMKWYEYEVTDLRKPQVQLLQEAIKSHDAPLVVLLLDLDRSLLSDCNMPPLCAVFENGVSVLMPIVDVLLQPCHDLRQNGVDEPHKQKSALGYAMQSSHTEIVEKAKRQFELDAKQRLDASAQHVHKRLIADAAQSKLQDWLDTAFGAGNPPAALMRALETEQWATALLLIREGASPFKTCYLSPDETTALHTAIQLGSVDVVHAALKQIAQGMYNSNVLQTVCAGNTPLLLSVRKKQFKIAEALLKAGADPWFHGSSVDSHMTAAQAIIDVTTPGDTEAERAGLELIQQLLSRELSVANADSKDISDQLGAIMYQAISKSLLTIAGLLVRQHVDVTKTCKSEAGVSSPLVLLISAAKGNSISNFATDMLREILLVWNATQTVGATDAAMHLDDQHKIISWLIEHEDVTISPFVKTKQDQRQFIQQLIDAHCIMLLEALLKELKMSCSGCHLHDIVNEVPMQLFDTLLKASNTVNKCHPESKTYLLHKAVEGDRGDIVEQLVQCNAKLKARDEDGNTALHLAVRCKDKNTQEQIIRTLIKKDPSLLKEVNAKNKTAADLISHKKKLEEWFQAFTSGVILENRDGDTQPSDSDTDSDYDASDEALRSFSLSRPKEPLSTKQKRVARLVQQMPDKLEVAAAAEAAEKKASQAEVPLTTQEQIEREAIWSALEGRLSAELPEKDAAAQDQPDDAPANPNLQVLDEDDLAENLVGLPWEFVISKTAHREWAGMDRLYRALVVKRLQRIGEGCWGRDGGTERRLVHVRGLEVYRTLLTHSGRIVFEVAADYSHTTGTYKEMIRILVVTLDHDQYEKELDNITKAHNQSIKARHTVKLKAVGAGGGDLHARVPKIYQALDQDTEDYAAALEVTADANVEVREYFPAASASQDTYTLLKFYNLSADLVKAVLRNRGENADVDFPFRVSPSEQEVIEYEADPPCSTVLVGRSGTGKTTCAVFKMWSRWLAFRSASTESFHQVFLTASPKLRGEVAKQFHKLRAAVLGPDEAKRLEEISNQDYASLDQVPSDAFPLFLTTKQHLRALDATLPKPFFPRLEGGGLVHPEHAHNEDMGGLESLIDMCTDVLVDESGGEDEEEGGAGEDGQARAGRQQSTHKKGSLGPKLEADFDFFVNIMWSAITTQTEPPTMTPAAVYQEICSFLKGSAEAMDCDDGKLTLKQYLAIGRKRAPTFNAESRQRVYSIFQRYEREKLRHNRYDHMDLLFHIYSGLKVSGYRGKVIHNIYRDEVQDFTQAEILLDLRTIADPNGLFCCGDPVQTIARGVSFRFADVCTLFHQESQQRKAAGGQAATMRVGQPKTPWHLLNNYRTHSGILGAAAAVVDVLRGQFPQYMDKLPREKAFFQGPAPLLLSSVNPDDLTFLLLGSDPDTSQVEFGAHQVILGRSKESLDSLPEHLLESNVIRMTVAQAKGLEFDDVFLWDFFSGSPADWRPLNDFTNELEEVERTKGAKKLPAGTPLVEVDVDKEDKGFLRLARNTPDIALCEEYKHLYTAVTRAKNNLVVFDRNRENRAPFFHYLRRLGLAQYTSKSVLEEQSDDSRYVLTQGKNSPEDWIHRGNTFLDGHIFDMAAHCYKVAKDRVRFTVASALVSAHEVKNSTRGRLTSDQQTQYFKVGHDVMVAASRADQAAVLVPVLQRKKWLAIAASMLSTSKDTCALAARLYVTSGKHREAVTAYVRCGELINAAQTCEALADANPEEANHWLQEAVKHYKRAKRHQQSKASLQGGQERGMSEQERTFHTPHMASASCSRVVPSPEASSPSTDNEELPEDAVFEEKDLTSEADLEPIKKQSKAGRRDKGKGQ